MPSPPSPTARRRRSGASPPRRTGTLAVNLPIVVAIAALLAIATLSYRQTSFAYPSGGGSYIVASDNLGELPGLTAAAALLIDYVLTVAASISAGVLALMSASPRSSPTSCRSASGVSC